MAQSAVIVGGKRYHLTSMRAKDVRPGTLARFAAGSVVRRIIGTDDGDVILRGVRSADVLEAVKRETFLQEWLRLIPADS